LWHAELSFLKGMITGDWVSRALAAVETASQQQGSFSGNGVEGPRAAIMRDGLLDTSDAMRLLSLHRSRAPVVSDAGWADLFVEALSDHFALSREVPDWRDEELRPNWAAAIARTAEGWLSASFPTGRSPLRGERVSMHLQLAKTRPPCWWRHSTPTAWFWTMWKSAF